MMLLQRDGIAMEDSIMLVCVVEGLVLCDYQLYLSVLVIYTIQWFKLYRHKCGHFKLQRNILVAMNMLLQKE